MLEGDLILNRFLIALEWTPFLDAPNQKTKPGVLRAFLGARLMSVVRMSRAVCVFVSASAQA